MRSTRLRSMLPALALSAFVGTAASADSITLFGQEYSVQSFDYSQLITWQLDSIPRPPIRLAEVEGIHFASNDRVYFSSDAISEVNTNVIASGVNKNWVIEASFTTSGNAITGMAFNRVILSNRGPLQTNPVGLFDLDPAGITINPTNSGIGAGGNLVVTSQKTKLRPYSLAPNAVSVALQPGGGPCPSGDCFSSTSNSVADGEDLAFVPGFGARQPGFYILDQEFPDRAVRYSLSGQLENSGSFLIGGDAPAMSDPDSIATPKGMCYMADSPFFPATVNRPGGTLLVALDNDVPGLQVFDFDGNMLAFEPLTYEVPSFTIRLPMGACDDVPQLESIAVDPATGRLFLVNQGNGFTCNILWVLTPVAAAPAGCSPADLANTDGDPAPDNSIDNGDFSAFFSAFFLPETDPARLLADIANTDGESTLEGAGPDGNIDNGDFTAFFFYFFLGCPLP